LERKAITAACSLPLSMLPTCVTQRVLASAVPRSTDHSWVLRGVQL
jgi:hypothetical protein